MKKRLVTRYKAKSSQAADENQRRVEGVFTELAAAKPANVSDIVLRLAVDSFVHVSFHDHGEDEVNPISSTAAFARFQDGHADRREGGVDQQTATLVGVYIAANGVAGVRDDEVVRDRRRADVQAGDIPYAIHLNAGQGLHDGVVRLDQVSPVRLGLAADARGRCVASLDAADVAVLLEHYSR